MPFIYPGKVNFSQIAGQIDYDQIPDELIDSQKLKNGGIATSDLTDACVTSAKISDGAVVWDKLNATVKRWLMAHYGIRTGLSEPIKIVYDFTDMQADAEGEMIGSGTNYYPAGVERYVKTSTSGEYYSYYWRYNLSEALDNIGVTFGYYRAPGSSGIGYDEWYIRVYFMNSAQNSGYAMVISIDTDTDPNHLKTTIYRIDNGGSTSIGSSTFHLTDENFEPTYMINFTRVGSVVEVYKQKHRILSVSDANYGQFDRIYLYLYDKYQKHKCRLVVPFIIWK